MSNLNDDDVAANRVHHADGSSSGDTPVVYPATTWMIMLNLLPDIIQDTNAAALRTQLKTLCSPS